ncbi:nitrite reductase small subunit NirD [Nocardiopsis algeriensis]|uniref:Nitrite reductase (NADH) small subunit n=1 Tax=Nocardiopsis algeriensis TaxID=1478215 RepID=A0A841ITN3_9ACTN|nr:nitrite reductase (NADH) small subunit [Nocardiopsis algeriensis]
MTTAYATSTTWIDACASSRLHTDDGIAVLLPGGRQAALFRTRDGHLYALDNIDPYTGAAVLARGIVGDRAGTPTITSPLLKHTFDLRTGHSLDSPHVRLTTWPVRDTGTTVQIRTPLAAP